MPGLAAQLATALRSRGARTGLIVLAASVVGHVSNYLFYVLSARALTPVQFAEISALMALGTIALMPSTGVQATVARDVASLVTQGRADEVPGRFAASARGVLRATALLGLVLVIATPAAVVVLELDSGWVWVLAVFWVVLAVALQTGLGLLQGLSRFGSLSAVLAGPQGAFRPLLLIPLVAAAGVAGAVGALVTATVLGLAIAAWGLRSLPWRQVRRAAAGAPVERLRSPLVAVIALLAFASLTNADLVAAKIGLDGDRAGQYASAALIGKIALYAPSALSTVLLPKVTARLEAGLDIAVPVVLTMLAAVGTGTLVVAAVALAPDSVITTVFGPDYAGATRLAVPLAAVMTLCALLNVQVVIALAAQDGAFLRLLAAAAVLHAGLLVVFAGDVSGIIVSTAVAAGLAVIVHEIRSPHALRRLLAAQRGRVEGRG